MDEYREALQRLVDEIRDEVTEHASCPDCSPRSTIWRDMNGTKQCAYHYALAVLARPEPDIEDEVNEGVWQLKLEGDRQDAAVFEAFAPSFEPAAAEKALRNCLLLANRRLHKGSTEVADWESIVRFCSEVGVRSSPLRNDAAEKAREPMHEGLPVDARVVDTFTSKVGTIVSYHCRHEVWWDDGSKSMDVHCGQLKRFGPLPSPPAATGETQ